MSIIVSAGTYHLPYDRLVDWMASWTSGRSAVRVIMQHGVSKVLEGADNRRMIPPNELLELYRSADAIVLQGGAGGVMDARLAGRRPIVVPRVPGGGEVVDDHQVQFARRLAAMGVVYSAESEDELHYLLDAALAGNLDTISAGNDVSDGATEVGEALSAPITKLALGESLRRTGAQVAALAINLFTRWR